MTIASVLLLCGTLPYIQATRPIFNLDGGLADLVSDTETEAANQSTPDIAAVIVDNRNSLALPIVIQNLHERLPQVPIQLHHGEQNEDFVKSQATLHSLQSRGVLHLRRLPGKMYRELDGGKFNRLYNELLFHPEFWDSTPPAKNILIFQSDSWVCPQADSLIKEFMQYDYVGAPWPWPDQFCKQLVGNGGFSLRKRSAMIDITRGVPLSSVPKAGKAYHLEDQLFCKYAKSMPDVETAASFAQGQTFNGKPSVGVHKPWVRRKHAPHDLEHLSRIDRVCPGAAFLESLQHEDTTSGWVASETAVQRLPQIRAMSGTAESIGESV